MIIGVPAESAGHEYRVGLSPFAVSRLSDLGQEIVVQRDAGAAARFSDRDYQAAGAKILYDAEEVYRRSEVVCRVGRVDSTQAEMMQPGALVCAFQHLAVASRELVDVLRERKVTVIGYELVRDDSGEYPIMLPFSDMAGQLALYTAARYLQAGEGGRGILLGAVPAVAPPTVLVLGAGRVGHSVAVHALSSGAHVIVIDNEVSKLRRIHEETRGQVVTIVAGSDRLEKYTSIADVVIGAVLIPGGRAPFLVSEKMVRGMKEGSVIVDLSIDQGGCVETSRPTSLADPVFVAHGVTHYCVPNMTANVARTASRALSSSILPYLTEIVRVGVDEALRRDRGLASGVYLHRGQLTNAKVAVALGIPKAEVGSLLGEGRE